MESSQERVPVVTAFVYSGNKIALIKRSRRVGTYRGKWAGFSGYVERLPLNQARVELQEEAGLGPDAAILRGIGIPLCIDDDLSGHGWLVFPFLFQLADGVEIRTDWESEEWGWFSPSELRRMGSVPGLVQAFDRVWPPFGDREFWNGLADVATDTCRGATELAQRGLVVLGGYVQGHWNSIDRDTLIRAIRAYAACRPAMGVFPGLAARLLLGIARTGGQFDFDDMLSELISTIEDTTRLSVLAAQAGLKGKKRVFTLSYSEAVTAALLEWYNGNCEVIVAESMPGREGAALFEHLSRRHISAVIIRDEDIPSAVRSVDAVIVGCDAIIESDRLVNKVGTLQAVSAANEAGVPAYAIAQTFKIAPPGWPLFLEPQALGDLGEAMDDAQAAGAAFDVTMLNRFDAIYTEEGILTRDRLEEIRTELGSVELVVGA